MLADSNTAKHSMSSTDPLPNIAAACSSRGRNTVVGMAVGTLSAFQTKNESYCITFELKDSDFDLQDWESSLKIKYFNKNESHLPCVLNNDVVLLRNIQVSLYQGRPCGIVGDRQTILWAIFRHEEDPTKSPHIITGPQPFSPTAAEKKIALALLDKYTPEVQNNTWRTGVSQQPSQIASSFQVKVKKQFLPVTLIKDLVVDQFTQIMGQVVKDNHYDSDKSSIWITDYTSNDYLVDHQRNGDNTGADGDSFGYLIRSDDNWPGPWGKLTIQVTLWEPHAGWCRNNVKLGDLVLLSYVRPKNSTNGSLEGAVHQDKKFPNKLHIRTISSDYDQHAKELMKRRKEYWEIHGKPKTETKHNKKKQKNEAPAKEPRKEEGQKVLSSVRSRRNQHVKIRDFGIPTRSVDSVLSAATHVISLGGGISYKLPFQNVAYNVLVRVVDFFPPDLADFAVEVPTESIVDQSREYMTWEWRFCFLVEGVEPMMSKDQPREQMKIFVSGADAVHLLCLDPSDLRRNPTKLAELREKLWCFWGNLEEKKQEAAANAVHGQPWSPPAGVSSLNTPCCIREYGVPCTHSRDPNAMVIDGEPCIQKECLGWERRFSLYGTVIHDS